jgi:antitoxin (DNA-binding transcriptional repressor) of toxin-antitoxin stability system
MREFSVREMRAGYGAISQALAEDGEVVLTHHGKPFAKVVPLAPGAVSGDPAAEQRMRARAWAAKQRRFLAGQPELPPFDWEEFRADRV